MPKTVVKIGLRDHGRRMRLEDFDHAEVPDGYFYELGRGAVVVVDVPGDRHFALVDYLRLRLSIYRGTQPHRIYRLAAGSDCKILLPRLQSERHPDVAVYKKPRPPADQDKWVLWVPELVIEVVSPGSEQRDYEEKREEYLEFGVREYWVVDADKEEVLVLRRLKGRWSDRVLRPPDVYHTRLLAGFELNCTELFEAARSAEG